MNEGKNGGNHISLNWKNDDEEEEEKEGGGGDAAGCREDETQLLCWGWFIPSRYANIQVFA